LWESGYHEARSLAILIADPAKINLSVLDRWASESENWAQCDACCTELFQKTQFASALPGHWSKSEQEYLRRAGLVMIAMIALHHKTLQDEKIEKYFPLLKRYSIAERNFVKKGSN